MKLLLHKYYIANESFRRINSTRIKAKIKISSNISYTWEGIITLSQIEAVIPNR